MCLTSVESLLLGPGPLSTYSETGVMQSRLLHTCFALRSEVMLFCADVCGAAWPAVVPRSFSACMNCSTVIVRKLHKTNGKYYNMIECVILNRLFHAFAI